MLPKVGSLIEDTICEALMVSGGRATISSCHGDSTYSLPLVSLLPLSHLWSLWRGSCGYNSGPFFFFSSLSFLRSLEAPALIQGNTSDQGFNLDLKRVCTPQSYRPDCCVDNRGDGWVLPQAERKAEISHFAPFAWCYKHNMWQEI